MTYHLRGANSGLIRAAVDLENGIVRLHSRGGATGGRPERNPGYSAAFNAILDRLHPQESLVRRVVLDSRIARRDGSRVILADSGDFSRLPLKEVKTQIRRRARDHGRPADAVPNQGNSTKQILFEVTLDRGELVRRLLAEDIGVEGELLLGANEVVEVDEDGAQGSSEVIESDQSDVPNEALPMSDEDRTWAEGHPKRVEHLKRERASGLADIKRRAFVAQYQRLGCERCGLVPSVTLGEHGDSVIEVHHEIPIARMLNGHETLLEDLTCLCANCHRIVHREMAQERA